MLQSKITKRWYSVETLTDAEKIALGFTGKIKKELSEIPKVVKETPCKKRKTKGD